MNNLKEKLELMQWLHSQRIKPAQIIWFDSYSLTGGEWSESSYHIQTYEQIKKDQPATFYWMPLEQVLELLVKCGKYSSYSHIADVLNVYGDPGDIHLEALKLLKQTLVHKL